MTVFRLLLISLVIPWIVFPPKAPAQQNARLEPKYGGRLVYGSLKDIATTNVFRNTISVDYNVRGLIFEGLTGIDKEGNIVPCLAKSWVVSKDGLVYTFSLRPGVKFHHGKGLTSEDAKWSLDYLRNPKNRAYYLDQFTEVQSIEAIDPLTMVITLKRPFSPFTTMVATTRAPILPAKSELPSNAMPAGTGPFRFVEWHAGRELTMKAFKEYWIKGIPYLDEILYRPILDDSVRVTALKAKQVDMADEIPYSVVAETSKAQPEFVLIRNEGAVRRRIVFNTRIPPFDNVKLRQAIAHAIDKKELAAAQTWGFAEPTNQRYPRDSFWFIDLKDREQDLKKAKALLAEAGYKGGLRVKVPVYPGPDLELTTVLKDQLNKVGIQLEFDMMDWAAHSKARRDHKFTMYAAGMGARTDPNQIYYADMYSKSRQNGSGYSNARIDAILVEANTVPDRNERKRLYTEVLKTIQRDVPEIYLYLGPKFLAAQFHVKGFSTGFLEDRLSYMGGGLPYTWLDQ